jgi:hypothetical protein
MEMKDSLAGESQSPGTQCRFQANNVGIRRFKTNAGQLSGGPGNRDLKTISTI